MSDTNKTKAPDWLSKRGKQIFRKLLAQLPPISPQYLDTLAMLAHAWDLYYMANEEVTTKGMNLTCQNGRLFINPACNVITEQAKRIERLSKLFGLSPQLEAEEQSEASPFADMLAGGEDVD